VYVIPILGAFFGIIRRRNPRCRGKRDTCGYQQASHHIKTEENPKPYHPDPVMSRLLIPRKNEARRGRHSKQETHKPRNCGCPTVSSYLISITTYHPPSPKYSHPPHTPHPPAHPSSRPSPPPPSSPTPPCPRES